MENYKNVLTMDNLDCPMTNKLLYNPEASDDNIKIIKGESTNLLVLEDTTFDWAFPLYQTMFNARWGIEDISMIGDAESYNKLPSAEKEAFDGTLSFLTFLDSLQVNNTGNVAEHCTAPEVTLCFAEQTAAEALHSVTYQHIYESLKLVRSDILKIYYKWKDIPVLYNRNKYIAKIYQDMDDNKTLRNYLKSCIADLLLEGLYFYNGFQFFYNLAARGFTMGTAGNIKLINKDESFHVSLYQHYIKEILEMCDEGLKEYIYSLITEMTNIALEQEIEWATLIYGGGKILGINNKSISDYTKSLAYKNIYKLLPNDNEEKIKMSAYKNPYSHLDKTIDLDGEGTNKAGFFERGTTDYMNVTVFTDFNEF